MPKFLVDLVNNHAGQRAAASEEEKETAYDTLGASIDVSESSEEAEGPSVDLPIPNFDRPHGKELLRKELSKMLKEAGDSTSTYASTLPHGLYGTYYCYRMRGPRRYLFGHMHSGSNNFISSREAELSTIAVMGSSALINQPKCLGSLRTSKRPCKMRARGRSTSTTICKQSLNIRDDPKPFKICSLKSSSNMRLLKRMPILGVYLRTFT
jgi:hypothetical protein